MAEVTVRDEFATDEIARLTLENPAMMAGLGRGNKPDTSGLTTAREMTGGSASLSADTVEAAKHELAAVMGLDASDVGEAILALTGGEKDQDSTAAAILELSRLRPAEVQELLLSDDDVSAEERRALAKRGLALPDGSYPVHDRKHLHSAAVLAASGHGDHVAAKRLIRKRAAELGIDISSLPGFEGGPEPEKRVVKKKGAAHYGAAGKRGQHHFASGGGGEWGTGSGIDTGGPSGGDGGTAMSGRRVLARDASGRLMTLQLTGEVPGGEDVELAARDMYDDYFGDQADTVRSQVHRAKQAEDDDPSVDHEAEVDRFLKSFGDSGFISGKTSGLPGSGYRNPSKTYGANITHRPQS